MNIFRILSAGDGHIYEPSISSFLAYLLDPKNDHGLGDEFLRSFVADFQECMESNFLNLYEKLSAYDVNVEVEYPVMTANGLKKDVDIVVEFSQNGKNKFVLCIENKIRESSIDESQLPMELEGVEKEFTDEKPEILFCYLTLKPSRKSAESFEKIKSKCKSSIHLFWIPSEHNHKSVYEKLQKLLCLSNEGCIDPIASDIRFLLTSFLMFVKKGFKGEKEMQKEANERRERLNYGKSVMEYIRDYANTLNTNESVRVADIKKFLSKSIEDACGLTPNMNTISRQLIASIVNNPTRIHYGVSQSNQQNYNWFYYPNVNNRSEVCRYQEGVSKVDQIYLK
ncbi:PD-(D/E)XK nuclease family protein [Candidatus Saccharibacteria bacterium]|nr:PD-(D/E)XK nuclease family protein [Candidatus Saccharibacteria bacterium]